MSNSKKVAIVTGSGRGIGKAIALKLAAVGNDIVVCDIDGKTVHNTAEEIRAMNQQSLEVVTDVGRKNAEHTRAQCLVVGKLARGKLVGRQRFVKSAKGVEHGKVLPELEQVRAIAARGVRRQIALGADVVKECINQIGHSDLQYSLV